MSLTRNEDYYTRSVHPAGRLSAGALTGVAANTVGIEPLNLIQLHAGTAPAILADCDL